MGIIRDVASLLIQDHLAQPFEGRIVQLGRQDVLFGTNELQQMLGRVGLRPANAERLVNVAAKRANLTDQDFFGIFGFSSIEALDFGEFDGANIAYDMNLNCLPHQFEEAFNVVFDGGTMEHVFHIPNFLKNIFQLLAVGGRVIHCNPASNCVDHGFYSFSPCFYCQYYRSNGFTLNRCLLLNLGSRVIPGDRITAYDYLPTIPRRILDGYLPRHIHYIYFVATKTAESTYDRTPQQSFWEEHWEKKTDTEQRSWFETTKAWIKSHPALEHAARKWSLPLTRLGRIAQTRSFLHKRTHRL